MLLFPHTVSRVATTGQSRRLLSLRYGLRYQGDLQFARGPTYQESMKALIRGSFCRTGRLVLELPGNSAGLQRYYYRGMLQPVWRNMTSRSAGNVAGTPCLCLATNPCRTLPLLRFESGSKSSNSAPPPQAPIRRRRNGRRRAEYKVHMKLELFCRFHITLWLDKSFTGLLHRILA